MAIVTCNTFDWNFMYRMLPHFWGDTVSFSSILSENLKEQMVHNCLALRDECWFLCAITSRAKLSLGAWPEKCPLWVNCAGWIKFLVCNGLHGTVLNIQFSYSLVKLYNYWKQSLSWHNLSHNSMLIQTRDWWIEVQSMLTVTSTLHDKYKYHIIVKLLERLFHTLVGCKLPFEERANLV